MERLKKEIKFLEYKINNECKIDREEKYKLSKQYHSLKLELLNLIQNEGKARPGIVAADYIKTFNSKPKKLKLESGIKPLDDKLGGGVEHGSFITLGGASHTGKSYITFEILANMAKVNSTVFFNFEMAEAKVVRKLEKFCKTENQLKNLIVDDESRGLDSLIMEITLYADSGVQLFVIDSMMKIESPTKEQHIHFSNISKALSKLAQTKNIVIILINQISEEDLKSGRLSFKGSGNIMYDSDISIFLTKDEDGKKHMTIAKNRQTEELFTMDIFLDEQGSTYAKNIKEWY